MERLVDMFWTFLVPCVIIILLFDGTMGNELLEDMKFGGLDQRASQEFVDSHTTLTNEVEELKSDFRNVLRGLEDMREQQAEMKISVRNLELKVEQLSHQLNRSDERDKLQEAGQTVMKKNRIGEETCDLDILFVLDGSGSVGKKNFASVKDWVKAFSKDIKSELQNVLVGVMQYSHKFSRKQILHQPYIKTYITIGDSIDQQDFARQLDKIALHGFTTYTGAALMKARLEFENSKNFNRTNAKQIMILVTDGLSSDWRTVSDSAKQLRKSGVIPFAIGIGGAHEPELRVIANGNTADPTGVFMLNDFHQLQDVTAKLKNAIKSLAIDCRGTDTLRNDTERSVILSSSAANDSHVATLTTSPTSSPRLTIGNLQENPSFLRNECDRLRGFTYRGECFWVIDNGGEGMTYGDANQRCRRYKNAKLADIYSLDHFYEIVTYLERNAVNDKWDWITLWTGMIGTEKTGEVILSDGKKVPYASSLLISSQLSHSELTASHIAILAWAEESPPVKENGFQQLNRGAYLRGSLCQLLE